MLRYQRYLSPHPRCFYKRKIMATIYWALYARLFQALNINSFNHHSNPLGSKNMFYHINILVFYQHSHKIWFLMLFVWNKGPMKAKVHRAHKSQNETLPTAHALDHSAISSRMYVYHTHSFLHPSISMLPQLCIGYQPGAQYCARWSGSWRCTWAMDLALKDLMRSSGPFILIPVFPHFKHWFFSLELS